MAPQLFYVNQRIQLTPRAHGFPKGKLGPTGRVMEYDMRHLDEEQIRRPYRVQLDNGSISWYAEYELSQSTHGLRTSNG